MIIIANGIYALAFQKLQLDKLVVNKDNDRHGHTSSEGEAIEWLFDNHGSQMIALAKDIAEFGRLFDPPLVKKIGDQFVVYDGNRRVSCLKLLYEPTRTPTKYRANLTKLSEIFRPSQISTVECQIEDDQQQIDLTLSRRHGGTDGGRG